MMQIRNRTTYLGPTWIFSLSCWLLLRHNAFYSSENSPKKNLVSTHSTITVSSTVPLSWFHQYRSIQHQIPRQSAIHRGDFWNRTSRRASYSKGWAKLYVEWSGTYLGLFVSFNLNIGPFFLTLLRPDPGPPAWFSKVVDEDPIVGAFENAGRFL